MSSARRFVVRWVRHAAMHAGAICAAVYHGVLPPQSSHTEEQLARLDDATAWQWFVRATMGRLDEEQTDAASRPTRAGHREE